MFIFVPSAEGLAGSCAGLQLCHSAADAVPADPEERAQGLPSELPSGLSGEHTEAGRGLPSTQEMGLVTRAVESLSSEGEMDGVYQSTVVITE